jgi:hypothetical protein
MSVSSPTQVGQSYEESLDELRAEYNDAISRARQKYEKAWAPFEGARNDALKRMTETYRPFLHASWQKARADYTHIAEQVDFTNGALGKATLLQEYFHACAAYEQALSEYDKVIGPTLT